MTTALTLPIARLRAAGCKVSTILGHDPNTGSFQYSVTLPSGIPGHYQRTIGLARIQSRPSEHRVFVWASAYQRGRKTPRDEVVQARRDTAEALVSLADHVECFDQSGSASRQHYIETGRYLNKSEDWCLGEARTQRLIGALCVAEVETFNGTYRCGLSADHAGEHQSLYSNGGVIYALVWGGGRTRHVRVKSWTLVDPPTNTRVGNWPAPFRVERIKQS